MDGYRVVAGAALSLGIALAACRPGVRPISGAPQVWAPPCEPAPSEEVAGDTWDAIRASNLSLAVRLYAEIAKGSRDNLVQPTGMVLFMGRVTDPTRRLPTPERSDCSRRASKRDPRCDLE